MIFGSAIKRTLENIPQKLGVPLNIIPFKYRLGGRYEYFAKEIERHLSFSDSERLEFVDQSFSAITRHFYHKSEFYRNLIDGSPPLRRENIPVLNKASFRNIPIEDRTLIEYGSGRYNTGGTSGSPLSFYAGKDYYAQEWAHMHYIWRKIGYSFRDTKITIRGKEIGSIFKYNFNQNEFLINAYANWNHQDYQKLLAVLRQYNARFIHGYPSAIYAFIKKIEEAAPQLLDFLHRNIRGVMFGSEYPLPLYRDYIESRVTANTVSWYGHTEGIILAAELSEKFEFVPFSSYGFAEAIEVDGFCHLVGTSFNNLATPFIRYDTEDLIEPGLTESGHLGYFKIKEGRIGEFVKDKNGSLISLTALIFGRHHKLFDVVDFIQIGQESEGKVTVYFSAGKEIGSPAQLFNSAHVNIDFSFIQRKEPYKTPLGKIPLLIQSAK